MLHIGELGTRINQIFAHVIIFTLTS